jgi:microcompartment protein CcmK/EutM
MQLARVVGHAISTVRHPSLAGQRLLVCQFVTAEGRADGEPVLALDPLGAGVGERVVVVNDGKALGEMLRTRATPARWMVQGIVDDRSAGG